MNKKFLQQRSEFDMSAMTPLHEMSPTEHSLTSNAPINVPIDIRYLYESVPLYYMCSSEHYFASDVPINVPPYIMYLYKSAPLHLVSPLVYSLTSGSAICAFPYIRCQPKCAPLISSVSIRVLFSSSVPHQSPCMSDASLKIHPYIRGSP